MEINDASCSRMISMRYGLALAALIVSSAFAQPSETLLPVDQAVADLDPLSTSLRRIEMGLRINGQHTSLFQLNQTSTNPSASAAPQGPVYYRIGQGFQARIDRPQYLIGLGTSNPQLNVPPLRDGQFVELVPPNTTFIIAPLQLQTPTPAPPPNPARINARIDMRIDSRVAPYTTTTGIHHDLHIPINVTRKPLNDPTTTPPPDPNLKPNRSTTGQPQ